MSESSPPVETDAPAPKSSDSVVKTLGILVVIAGVVLLLAGVFTWANVASHLSNERIVVSEDAGSFAGSSVMWPWQAYSEADVIQLHALEATDGKTYAELEREDPLRQTAMTASFLRASLFTSVVAFGVALMAIGIGVVNILVGIALTRVANRE